MRCEWKDLPDVPGRYLTESRRGEIVRVEWSDIDEHGVGILAERGTPGTRWFGPIPQDTPGDKP